MNSSKFPFPKRLYMFMEADRLATFKDWVFGDDEKCNARNLARSGFFFIGNDDEPDSVQCFMCSKALDGWEANDDPWDEHYKHSPECVFVKNRLDEDSYILSDFFKLKHTFIKSVTKELRENVNNHYNAMLDLVKDI